MPYPCQCLNNGCNNTTVSESEPRPEFIILVSIGLKMLTLKTSDKKSVEARPGHLCAASRLSVVTGLRPLVGSSFCPWLRAHSPERGPSGAEPKPVPATVGAPAHSSCQSVAKDMLCLRELLRLVIPVVVGVEDVPQKSLLPALEL